MLRTVKKIQIIIFFCCISGFFAGCTQSEERGQFGSGELENLPMIRLPLESLDEFRKTAQNWSIAGNVQSDYETTGSMKLTEGTGVLVNSPEENQRQNIFTGFEHGDIELKLEFLVPKGSNSGVYLQGRYEVQILDSWLKPDPSFSDVGGVYERWNDAMPEGEQGYEGKAPEVNASLAPGLWQEYHIIFRAPRFDEAGNKIKNARFERVYLNGALIQKDVEVTGPTRGASFQKESATGPIMLQGDHGPVAFRNIEFKTYESSDSLELSPLTYKVYDYEGDRLPQNFDTLKVIKEGITDSFNVASISPKNEHFATQFTGELNVPVSGDYLFETQMGNGGNLYIDGELILENTGELEGVSPGRIIYLEEGSHQLEVTHFQIVWSTYAAIYYEGPNMEKRMLASKLPWGNTGNLELLTVENVTGRPEIIGGFTNYEGEKRTHTLSVGFSDGIHYSYDLQNGALLKFWRDPFADLTQMWVDRGYGQLLEPMNAAVEDRTGSILIIEGMGYNLFSQERGVREYTLNSDGEPVFRTRYSGITVDDYIHPDENGPGFMRRISFSAEEMPGSGTMARIAQSRSFEKVADSRYRIDGRYYLELIDDLGESAEIIHIDDSVKALVIPVLQSDARAEIEYRLIW